MDNDLEYIPFLSNDRKTGKHGEMRKLNHVWGEEAAQHVETCFVFVSIFEFLRIIFSLQVTLVHYDQVDELADCGVDTSTNTRTAEFHF